MLYILKTKLWLCNELTCQGFAKIATSAISQNSKFWLNDIYDYQVYILDMYFTYQLSFLSNYMEISIILCGMMMSSNESIFRITGPLCGISPVTGEFSSQRLVTRMFSLIWDWTNDWVNNRDAGGLRRYRAHYGVTVMEYFFDTAHWSVILFT